MIKPLLYAVAAHLIVLSFAWVGFAVPLPRSQTDIAYTGALPADDLAAEADKSQKSGIDAGILQDEGAGFFKPWIQMRELIKPRN